MTSQTLYDILGVLEDATPDEIKAAYRRKIRHVHPDRGGSKDAAAQVNAAYDVLSDSQQRSEYDASRRGAVARCPFCEDSVHSEDELLGHLVRHRAEVEAAKIVIEREAQAEAASPPREVNRGDEPKTIDQERSASTGPESGRPIRESGGRRSNPMYWVIAVALLTSLAAVVFVFFALNRSSSFQTSSSSSPVVQSSTVTQVTVTTLTRKSTTTLPPIEIAGATWSLPTVSDSLLPTGGAVGPALSGSRAEWFSDYDSPGDTTLELKYLLFDGQPRYDVVDWGCLTTACDTYLTYMTDGPESVWVVDGEKPNGELELSQSLHFLSPSTGSLLTCWSDAYDGPVIAVRTSSSGSPTVGEAWVFTGDVTNGSWFGLEPSLIDPESFMPLPFSDQELPACLPSTHADEIEALFDGATVSEASDLLFGPSADWTDTRGMVSDSLIDASISWADLSLIVDGELSGLDVLTGGCVHADCASSLMMAVADGNWDREVWWFFDSEGASQALGFELTESESNGHFCWSEQYDLPVVYTVGQSAASEAVRAWIFDTDRKWYPAEIAAIQLTSESYGDGDFSRC